MTNKLSGVQRDLLNWLAEDWRISGHGIALVEGFPGVGKTAAIQEFGRVSESPDFFVTATAGMLLEDLLLAIASALDERGISDVADSEDWGDAVVRLLSTRDVLLVIDNFDELLTAEGEAPAGFRNFLRSVASKSLKGRMLLVSSRSPAEDSWLSQTAVRTLGAPPPEQSLGILKELLKARVLHDDVPQELLDDVAAWLGHNPRAMRAFVACLRGEAFGDLIEIDPESWELRNETPSRSLLERLEREFWGKTLGRLDAEALALAENLSVFRKPFRSDAIRAAGATIRGWEAARDSLSSGFALEKSRNYFALNPIVRQLSSRSLRDQRRRYLPAHSRAADYFARRVSGDSTRDAARAGTAFVEARFHFTEAGLSRELDDLAGEFRRVLLPSLRQARLDADNPTHVRELTPVLLAALSGQDEGYDALRAELVILLMARHAEGDAYRAIRQGLIASKSKTRLAFWLAYVRAAEQLETDRYLRSIARLALQNCPQPEHVARRVSEALLRKNSVDLALAVLDDAISLVKGDQLMHLLSQRSFILERAGRNAEALEFLTAKFREMDASDTNRLSYRLFEEACFIALHQSDRNALSTLGELAVAHRSDKRARGREALAHVLLKVIDFDWAGVIEEGIKWLSYPAIAAQVAFAHLVLGDPASAGQLVSKIGVQNRAGSWLVALIAFCSADTDTYIEAIGRTVERELTDDEIEDQKFWLRIWEQVPEEKSSYPSFYFPILPMSLTGLSMDLVRRSFDSAQIEMVKNEVPRLPVMMPVASATVGTPVVQDDADGTRAIHVRQETVIVAGDQYSSSGQVGAMGKNASVHGDVTQNQDSGALSAHIASLMALAEARGDELELAQLSAAREAADRGDASQSKKLLQLISGWIADKAGDAGVGVAVAAITSAIGM